MDVWQLSAKNGQENQFLVDITVVSAENRFSHLGVRKEEFYWETDVSVYRRFNCNLQKFEKFREARFIFTSTALRGLTIIPFRFRISEVLRFAHR